MRLESGMIARFGEVQFLCITEEFMRYCDGKSDLFDLQKYVQCQMNHDAEAFKGVD